jgi:hypothetical protein
MSEVVEVWEGSMSAKTDIDHNFVVTNPASLIRCSWNCGLVSSTSSLRSVRPKVRDTVVNCLQSTAQILRLVLISKTNSMCPKMVTHEAAERNAQA